MQDDSDTAIFEGLYVVANALVAQTPPNTSSAGGGHDDTTDWQRWWVELWLDAAAVFAEFTAWVSPPALVIAVGSSMSAEDTNLVDISLLLVACLLVFAGCRRLARALANRSRGAVLLSAVLIFLAGALTVSSLAVPQLSKSSLDAFHNHVSTIEFGSAFVILVWCLCRMNTKRGALRA